MYIFEKPAVGSVFNYGLWIRVQGKTQQHHGEHLSRKQWKSVHGVRLGSVQKGGYTSDTVYFERCPASSF